MRIRVTWNFENFRIRHSFCIIRMGNHRISALRLWESGWSHSYLCAALCVCQASIYRWRHIFDEFGSVTPPAPPLHGRPRIIGLAVLTAVKELYERHPDTYLDELQWYLAIHHDIPISISSLQENLEKAGLTRKVLHKIASERDEERRNAFLHSMRNDFSGTEVVVDESSMT
jgi:transposase